MLLSNRGSFFVGKPVLVAAVWFDCKGGKSYRFPRPLEKVDSQGNAFSQVFKMDSHPESLRMKEESEEKGCRGGKSNLGWALPGPLSCPEFLFSLSSPPQPWCISLSPSCGAELHSQLLTYSFYLASTVCTCQDISR